MKKKMTAETIKTARKIELIVDGKKVAIDETIAWKIWFNRLLRKPIGKEWFVCVAGLDETLPRPLQMQDDVEEREAIMIILPKKRGG